ncbi:MAG: dioxygenase [Deltaproteobacteria bacterium]|nr:dioxygenase [Deltaproteobacteria bacterium]
MAATGEGATEGSSGDGSTGEDGLDAGSSGDSSTGGIDSCSAIPQETAGPYPSDGTNGPDALSLSGIVRPDIRASIGDATGVAQGVLLTVTLTLVDPQDGCAPLAGHAVYLWHCNRDGQYSMYDAGIVGENYLRGVQTSDEHGQVSFTTIFPGCYSGRWPHIHFEVYEDAASATNGDNAIVVSQLALPEAACAEVYAVDGYAASVSNLARASLTSDNVFGDGVSLQLAEVTGDVDAGLEASLVVGV